MVSTTPEIQDRVQRLVMDYGEYVPVELLLATNRLDYDDYREWREGGLDTLDDVLAEDSCVVRNLLRNAESCARELGLEPEPAVYLAWGDNAEAALAASANPQLNELLCTRFRRADDGAQTDLFLDSASTRALNELVRSLAAGDTVKARDALDRLLRVDPGHRQRDNAGVLVKVLELPLPDRASDGLVWLKRMERDWVPAASDLLGVRARDFLAPLWRAIGRAIETEQFDPGCPAWHASRAYREGFDWEGVKSSVLAVSEYDREPILLARLAEANWWMRDRAGAIEAWFTLCLTAPLEFEKLIESSSFPDWALRNAWHLALERDFPQELAPCWFPAWMLLEEPGLSGVLGPRPGVDPPSRAFETVRALLAHPQPDERGMELRGALQVIHPGLLKRFLER